MFPGKADLFLRKWEGNIVPKLQKMSTVKNPLVMQTDNESEGRLLCSFCQNIVFLSVDTISFSSLKSAIIPAMKSVIIFCVFLSLQIHVTELFKFLIHCFPLLRQEGAKGGPNAVRSQPSLISWTLSR